MCVCVCRSLGSHSRICQILTVGELYICKLTYSILYLKPQDQALSHFCDHLSHMQSTEMFKWPPTHIPSEGHIRPCSACLLQLCYCKQVSFLWSSSCCIFVLSVGDLLFEYILAWRIPWTEEPGGPQSRRSQRVRHGEQLTRFTFTLLFEMTPRQSAEVPSGVPKCGKTVMCLTGKRGV